MSAPTSEMPVVTTPTVNGMPHRQQGLVVALGFGTVYEDAFKRAVIQLQAQARQIGGDAVEGLLVTVIREDGKPIPDFRIALAGTAVKLPWPDGSADPLIYTEGRPGTG